MGNQSDYGNNIEGIPLQGDLPQVQGSSSPNRDHSYTLSDPEGEKEAPYRVDYFDAAQADLGNAKTPVVQSKDNEQWSAGIEDEENDYGYVNFSELDNDWKEGVFPETEPLEVQGTADEQSDEELSYTELEPDNIQHGPE